MYTLMIELANNNHFALALHCTESRATRLNYQSLTFVFDVGEHCMTRTQQLQQRSSFVGMLSPLFGVVMFSTCAISSLVGQQASPEMPMQPTYENGASSAGWIRR